ncbi:MAG: RNA 2',3'-cyclic phosphodiesterase [Actinobacteria bacterium]|nr:RNA 2',3'-cyclic phosphodiesterase [Actinomycetota bacterium]
MQKIRLFWAVNLPPGTRKKLCYIGDRLREAGADAKWVEENNLHVTVKFLGDADPGMVDRITEGASGRLKDLGRFSLEPEGMGFFPGAHSPKVLWVGLGGDVGTLCEAALAVEDAMEGLGFPREGRKFSPHLTLARIRSPRNVERLAGLVHAEAAGINGLGIFDVDSVDLMSSTLTGSGPVYRPIARIKLA